MFDWGQYWHYGYGHLRSWVSEILDRFAYTRASRSWQTTGAITTTAMVEDGERPKEKPRPPSGGHTTPLPSQN
jgi:hypothetical protein